MTSYDQLKEIIQKANTEITNQPCTHRLMHDENGCPFGEHSREIRLADVLLAMDKATRENSYFVDSEGCFHEWFAPKGRLDLRTVSQWNLKDNNLDHQSDETKQFLIDLLTK